MSNSSQKGSLGIRLVLRALLLLGLLLAFFVALTFVTAGRLDYWQGWVFNGLNILFLLLPFIVLRNRKDLIKERQKPGKGMKKWDKFYYLISTLLFLVMFITSVLDAGRFSRPSTAPLSFSILGCVVYSIGQILVLWAKKANRFFSSVVRIQADRGQTVCTDGPYRFIRHPGYLGGLIFNLATPLLLGSYWGLIPAIPLMIALVVRTYLEDKTLLEELTGYPDYARKVPFRLIPHIW
jgi:protein-S-isoprenylcysteine O-methyltransferase Ste14